MIVVGDVHDGPLPGVERLVTDAGFRYLSFDAGHHCWGHCQLNYALPQAQGSHIHMSDDDDIWTDNARDLMRRGTDVWPEKVLLYQFRSYYGNQVYWVPGTAGVFERARVGGHCALVPNVPEKVGRFSCEYDGDYDYVESSVKNFGGLSEVIWISELVAIARP